MMLQQLKTGRLILRQLSIDDKEEIFALRSNQINNKYLARQISKNLTDAVNFINAVNENMDKQIAYYWAITLKNTNEFLGTICLFSIPKAEKTCKIGYELMPKNTGKGFMNEALGIVIDYAFETLGLNNLYAVTHCDNLRSINLLLKLDFKKSSAKNEENAHLETYLLEKPRTY